LLSKVSKGLGDRTWGSRAGTILRVGFSIRKGPRKSGEVRRKILERSAPHILDWEHLEEGGAFFQRGGNLTKKPRVRRITS